MTDGRVLVVVMMMMMMHRLAGNRAGRRRSSGVEMLLSEGIDLACASWTLLEQCVSIRGILPFDDPIEFDPFIMPETRAVDDTDENDLLHSPRIPSRVVNEEFILFVILLNASGGVLFDSARAPCYEENIIRRYILVG